MSFKSLPPDIAEEKDQSSSLTSFKSTQKEYDNTSDAKVVKRRSSSDVMLRTNFSEDKSDEREYTVEFLLKNQICSGYLLRFSESQFNSENVKFILEIEQLTLSLKNNLGILLIIFLAK